MSYVLIGCCAALAAIFAASAAGKVRRRAAYAEFVAATRRLVPAPVPRPIARAAAHAVVALEIALPVALFAVPLAGLAVAGGLLAVFTVAVLLAVRRGVREPCRCFGPAAAPLGYRHALRAGMLAGLALLGGVAAVAGRLSGPLPELRSGTVPGGVAAALAAATVVAALAVRFDDVADLFAAPGYRSGGSPSLERT